jgi:hypothetical protein
VDVIGLVLKSVGYREDRSCKINILNNFMVPMAARSKLRTVFGIGRQTHGHDNIRLNFRVKKVSQFECYNLKGNPIRYSDFSRQQTVKK